ncbi:MAG: energy transducer TonB, partial [Candidatus Eisenbacteria bacterium]|nr:energy transducer TonB [Candidatus Eisenbacteria bacterium]
VRVEGTLSTRRLVHLVNPAFPPQASSGGVVKVRLAVRADGTVRTATLALKAHPLLDEAALGALRQWRFAPASGAADAEGVVTVEFVLR